MSETDTTILKTLWQRFQRWRNSTPEQPLREGDRITFLVGGGRRPQGSLSGQPAVSGRVRASTVQVHPHRVDAKWAIDVVLTDLVTWRYNELKQGVEVHPADHRASFRIGVPDNTTVAKVAAMLHGDEVDLTRATPSELIAFELPWGRCPDCGTSTQAGAHFCHGCGRSLRVIPRGTTARREREQSRCPLCTEAVADSGTHCPACGRAFDTARQMKQLAEDRPTVSLLLVADHRRLVEIEATLEKLQTFPYGPSEPPRLFARLSNVVIAELRASDRVKELPGEVPLLVTLQADDGDFASVLRQLADGELVRATEYRRRCVDCQPAEAGREPRFVDGFHCSWCGKRQRLTLHPSVEERSEKQLNHHRHTCGAVYEAVEDRHCPGCGDDLRGFDPRGSRLANLTRG